VPESNGGSNNLKNAIALCLRCHGEVGHYNINHPIGKKYSSRELHKHRDNWWEWCKENPATPLPKDPISVSPGFIDLGTGKWKAHSLFKVYNKTCDVYYQIVVKFTINMPEILPRDIKIDLSKPKDELDAQVGTITISGDIFRINGVDQAGNNAIFLWLASLDPGEVCTLLLTNKSCIKLPALAQPRVYIGVCDFDQKPATTKVKPGTGFSIPFKLPKNFVVEGFSLLIKSNS